MTTGTAFYMMLLCYHGLGQYDDRDRVLHDVLVLPWTGSVWRQGPRTTWCSCVTMDWVSMTTGTAYYMMFLCYHGLGQYDDRDRVLTDVLVLPWTRSVWRQGPHSTWCSCVTMDWVNMMTGTAYYMMFLCYHGLGQYDDRDRILHDVLVLPWTGSIWWQGPRTTWCSCVTMDWVNMMTGTAYYMMFLCYHGLGQYDDRDRVLHDVLVLPWTGSVWRQGLRTTWCSCVTMDWVSMTTGTAYYMMFLCYHGLGQYDDRDRILHDVLVLPWTGSVWRQGPRTTWCSYVTMDWVSMTTGTAYYLMFLCYHGLGQYDDRDRVLHDVPVLPWTGSVWRQGPRTTWRSCVTMDWVSMTTGTAYYLMFLCYHGLGQYDDRDRVLTDVLVLPWTGSVWRQGPRTTWCSCVTMD